MPSQWWAEPDDSNLGEMFSSQDVPPWRIAALVPAMVGPSVIRQSFVVQEPHGDNTPDPRYMTSKLLDMKGEVRALQVHCKRIEAKDTWALRHSVLWPDKDIAFVQLPADDEGVHLGAFLVDDDREVPAAIISLFPEGIPHNSGIPPAPHTECTIRFRKFACNPAYQRQGIGSQLLEYAASFARSEMNGVRLWCDARTSTLEWYQKRGFEKFGECFYKGPVEYIRIQREIQ
ncbi:hypothetical protein NP233_g3896 [Leucocoprinus birnbaumii]|uniref:N-acetyltransferase domain-containing protein n=1 Tax=Leucocoprinus birnbaumii TaxID=56174 RepID=A0AAD5YW22_9AGAR|nr:hypothetical protein NP233_g3896 [Leucocoprinus birnbaumii]